MSMDGEGKGTLAQVAEVSTVICDLLTLQCDATPALFDIIFGSSASSAHLWFKFVTQYDSNLLFLWSSLDTANRGLVVDYLGNRHKRVSGVFQVLV